MHIHRTPDSSNFVSERIGNDKDKAEGAVEEGNMAEELESSVGSCSEP
jgi:hypothetical protein